MFTPALILALAQPADPASFENALVSSEGLDAGGFDAAVRLRLPDVELRRTWDLQADRAALGRFVFVHVSQSGETLAVEMITEDGRAFVRTVPLEDEPERIAASFVVSLLTSIELEEVRADRDDVEAPPTPTEDDVQEAVQEARGEEEPEPEPEPPEPEPDPEPEPQPEEPPPEPAPVAAAPRWGLDVTPAFGVLFGLVPTDFESRVGGGGGELTVHGRSPRNVLVGGALRIYGRDDGAHDLVRVRVGASVGYVWSWQKAELLAGGIVGFTNWSVRRDGERLSPVDLGAQTTLVSAAGWVAGGPLFRLDRPRLKTIRVGGRLELGGGFVLSEGARAVALFDAEGNDLFRIGGLELTTGLDVTLSFAWSP